MLDPIGSCLLEGRPSVSGTAEEHYARLASSYDENWAYSPGFISWMAGSILDRLDLQPEDRVVDLGCGTGLYSKILADQVDQVVCVDPSAEMLNQLPSDDAFRPIMASAEEIASRGSYSAVI